METCLVSVMERSVDLVISLSHNNKSKEKGNKELEFQKKKMIVPDTSSLTWTYLPAEELRSQESSYPSESEGDSLYGIAHESGLTKPVVNLGVIIP